MSRRVTAHLAGIAALALVNLAMWAAARWGWLADANPADLWQGQMALAQALLLFDTLVLVWVYTYAAQKQAEATEKQVKALRLQRSDENKPIVVTQNFGNQYSIRNIGPGVAVNCFIVVPVGPHEPDIHPLGALAAGSDARPTQDNFMLNHVPVSHIVVAEALYTRTQQWQASLNVLEGNRVFVRFAEFTTSGRVSFSTFLKDKWPTLHEQLKEYQAEVSADLGNPLEVESAGTWKAEGLGNEQGE